MGGRRRRRRRKSSRCCQNLNWRISRLCMIICLDRRKGRIRWNRKLLNDFFDFFLHFIISIIFDIELFQVCRLNIFDNSFYHFTLIVKTKPKHHTKINSHNNQNKISTIQPLANYLCSTIKKSKIKKWNNEYIFISWFALTSTLS